MAAPLIAMGVMAGMQLWSGMQQAQAIRRQAQLNQEISKMNVKQMEIEAFEAERFGYTQSTRYQSVIDSTIASQRVAMASQGVDITSGTAKEIQTDSQFTGFLNTLDMRAQARAKAKGIKRQASNTILNSAMGVTQANYNAQAATTKGMINAANTGISAYSYWDQRKVKEE